VGVKLTDLIQTGILKVPADVECIYRKTALKAKIQEDGTVIFGGESYGSLSTAATMARKSVVGELFASNGWTFWKYHDPKTGRLVEIDVLRQDFLKTHGKKA
jgi:hypothetical protein